MKTLHENQKKILEYLLEHAEGATLDELSEHLGITKTAAKEHLLKVDRLGLLTYQDVKGNVGRPRRYYQLSQEGHETFPRQYLWFSNMLLEYLAEARGEEAVSRVMEGVATRLVQTMKPRFTKTQTTAELLGEVTRALNELGYRATLKQSDLRKGAIIDAINCVYHSVAKTHPQLCKFDITFIKAATDGMNVQLQSCIAKGDNVCRFCIRKTR